MTETRKNIILLKEVESTNNYAKRLIANEVVEGTVVLAHYQKRGKGRGGNSWESQAGKNLLASIILFPDFLEAGRQFQISKIASLALVELIKAEIGNVKIKWPNDIYVDNKKIAGILIENSIKGGVVGSSVIGIGLNLNQTTFVSNAPNPVSLSQLTGKDYDIESMTKDLLNYIHIWYVRLKDNSEEEIDLQYFSHLYRNKGWHIFKKEKQRFEARVEGIGKFGQLQLKDKNGKIKEYMFKEVEFVI